MERNTLVVGAGMAVVAAVFFLDRCATHRELDALRGAVSDAHAKSSAIAPSPIAARTVGAATAMPSLSLLGAAGAGFAAAAPSAGVDTAAQSDAPPRTNGGERGRSPRPASRAESFAAIHDTMEAAFVGESTDAAWARDAHRTAQSSLAQHLPDGSRITAVECRSTMCRIQSEHRHDRAADQFVSDALGDPERPPWNGGFATGVIEESAPGGGVTLVTYLMREGVDLPPADRDMP